MATETARRRARTSVGLVVVAAAIVSLASCAPPREDGPLTIPPDVDTTCMPADLYAKTAWGTSLINESNDRLTVTRVEMVGADGLTLVSNSLMPSPDYFLLADAFPPVKQFPNQWPLARDITEASIAPSDEHVSLVSEVHLDDGADDGHFDGLEIFYENNDGVSFVLRTERALDILRGSCA